MRRRSLVPVFLLGGLALVVLLAVGAVLVWRTGLVEEWAPGLATPISELVYGTGLVSAPTPAPPPKPSETPTPFALRTVAPSSTPTAMPTFTSSPTQTPAPTESATVTATMSHTPTPTPAEPQPGEVRTFPLPAGGGAEMVYVPAGEFLMGSAADDLDAYDDERPQHTVYLDPFWIDRTEVTNPQFAAFVVDTGHETTAEVEGCGWIYSGSEWICIEGADWQHPRGSGSGLDGLDSHPVVLVSWDDAVAYCDWRGARLPTEAEWEKTARGEEGLKYPWGNAFDCYKGNFDDETEIDGYVVAGGPNCDGYIRTAPVGSFPAGASPYRALDMAGNVREWCGDWYDETYYGRSPAANPTGPDSGEYRVVRGGSWGSYEWHVHAAFRLMNERSTCSNVLGFRCASSSP